jgi:hypothetical protein
VKVAGGGGRSTDGGPNQPHATRSWGTLCTMDRDHDAVWATICDHPPVGHMLQAYAPDRWVRFHSLPDGRRYPETPDEYDELLYRTDVLVGELSQPGDDLMLVTGLYGRRGAPHPEPSSAQQLVQPDARYWCTVDATRDTDDDALWPLHLWVGWRPFGHRALDTVVRLVADDELAAVIVVVPDRLVAIHPYHGGVDLLFPTTEERDAVRRRYVDWTTPPG